MGKYRMNEPYGFMESEGYVSVRSTIDNEIATNRRVDQKQTDESFAKVEYDKDLEAVIFKNADNEAIGQLPMTDIAASSLIKEAKYDSQTQELVIIFDNDDEVRIDLNELINQQEAGDGLKIEDNIISIKIAEDSENFLQVTSDGIKNVGIQDAIDVEKERAMTAEAQEVADRTADVDEEEARAKAAEATLNQLIIAETNNRIADVDEEETRAKAEETALDEKIEQETSNRIADVDEEEARAKAAETALNEKIEQETSDRIADVDEEETRAKAEELRLTNTIGTAFSTASTETVTAKFNDLTTALSNEISNRTTQDNQLQNNINNEVIARQGEITRVENLIIAEVNRAKDIESGLRNDLTSETSRATAEELRLNNLITDETTRALSAETELQNEIDNLESTKADKSSVYTKEETDTAISTEVAKVIDGAPEAYDTLKEISEYISSDTASAATMIADISQNKADITALKGKDEELQSAIDSKASTASLEALSNDVAAHTENGDIHITATERTTWNEKIDITALNGYATEAWVGEQGYLTEHQDISNLATKDEVNAVDAKVDAIDLTPYAKTTDVDAALELKADKTYVDEELLKKADAETTYTKEEVDEMIAAKETEITKANTEIYNLKKIVGDMGGNVTYDLPGEGKSFNALMGNNGTVKLSEDVTTSRFGPGITAKNKVTLNLNNNDLTISGLTTSSSQPGIMARGTQEITIGGKGTIDVGGGICVETTSTGCTINLTGSTTTYQTDRSGGELIYCYSGTINISNGTFRNNGADKKFLLNCYDANYQNGTAKIIVTGGKFYDFNPADNTAEGEHTNFLAEGYHVEASTVTEEGVEHTVYTVKKDA